MTPYRVLLADDHELVRFGIRRIIEENSDFKVVAEVRDGQMLLQVVEEVEVDLVIMDISMPDLSGIEATKKLRDIYPHLKILILTMHKSRDLLDIAIDSGANGYVLKEDAAKDLISAMKSVLQGGNFISSHLTPILKEYYFTNHRRLNHQKNEKLTRREIEILKLIAKGNSSKRISNMLSLSFRTVQNHRNSILRKLSFKKSTELTRYAFINGYLPY